MSVTGKPAQIMDALFARVALLETTGPTMPIAWPEPDEPFVPPADGKYLRVSFFPNRPAWEGISSGKLDQGLLQIDVVWPKNLGLIAPAQVAAQVETHFAKSSAYVSGTTKVTITREPWTAQPISEADKVSLPITISWAA